MGQTKASAGVAISANERHLLFDGKCGVALVHQPVDAPGAGEVVVQIAGSAVSAGTELLVYRGQLPDDMAVDATIDSLADQNDRYPMRYGYAVVGQVITLGDGVEPTWMGRRVFLFAPHGSHAIVSTDQLVPIPDDIPNEDALFLPNMETAVSFVMDGRPVIGERVLILGQGIVGLLTTCLLAPMPLAELVVVDRFEKRLAAAVRLGAHQAISPENMPNHLEVDLAYELSGNPNALNSAIEHTGFAGRIVIGSWYGTKQAPLDLGGHFHRSHMKLISSQVSYLNPQWHGRWTKSRRLDVAWEMIRRHQPSQLITHRFALEEASQLYEMLDQRAGEALQTILINYQ